MAFNVDASAIRRFELPLDQEISVVDILVLGKRDLEVFIARTRDGNVGEGELRHSATTYGFYRLIGRMHLCLESRISHARSKLHLNPTLSNKRHSRARFGCQSGPVASDQRRYDDHLRARIDRHRVSELAWLSVPSSRARRRRRSHSHLNASSGSTAAARLVGAQQASSVTPANSTPAPTSVAGSGGSTSKRKDRSTRGTMSAPALPTTMPPATRRNPSPRTRLRMSRR